MKLATLICLSAGEVDGEVETFNIDTSEGKEMAINAWKSRIRETWESESETEIFSRIEEGIINDYSYVDRNNDYSFQLFWNELIGPSEITHEVKMDLSSTKPNFEYSDGVFNKIGCIRVIREVTGASLSDAKKFTEGHFLFLRLDHIKTLESKGVFVKVV